MAGVRYEIGWAVSKDILCILPICDGDAACTTAAHCRLSAVRGSAGLEEFPMGSLAQEARAYGQVRGVSPFSCAYLAAEASTRGRTSA